jgi:hypothetical protein
VHTAPLDAPVDRLSVADEDIACGLDAMVLDRDGSSLDYPADHEHGTVDWGEATPTDCDDGAISRRATGDPAEETVADADTWDHEMTVIGTDGRGGFGRTVVESLTEDRPV